MPKQVRKVLKNQTSLDKVINATKGPIYGDMRGLAKLIRDLHNQGWTLEEIADEIGCTIAEANTVIRKIKK